MAAAAAAERQRALPRPPPAKTTTATTHFSARARAYTMSASCFFRLVPFTRPASCGVPQESGDGGGVRSLAPLSFNLSPAYTTQNPKPRTLSL